MNFKMHLSFSILLFILFFIFGLCLSSCGDTNFKKVELLDQFRILAITTATPEVQPGDTVSDIQVVFSDPKGGGRLISGTTESCIDPGIAFGASVSCDHDPMRVTGTYDINTLVDDDTPGFFTGVSSMMATVTVPATILLGRSASEQNNGVGYIIIFTFDVSGQQVKAFKRILASTRSTKNLNPGNPSPSVITLNGGALALPTKNDTYQVLATSQENFDVITTENVTETRTENFQVAWYISEGELSFGKSNVSENVTYLTETPQSPFVLIAVIRDERGGVEVLSYSF